MKVLGCVTSKVLAAGLEQDCVGQEKDEYLTESAVVGRLPFSDSTNTLFFCAENMKGSSLSVDIHNQSENHGKENAPFKNMCEEPASPKPTLRLNLDKHKKDAAEDVDNNNVPGSPEPSAPLTPTANLKMLISAVSPEIRNRDKQTKRKELFKTVEDELEERAEEKPEQADDQDDLMSSQESEKGTGSRKEKSLGLLCQRFLSRFPEYPAPGENIDICLDEVAKDLRVERRRIYDIVNVLESVEMVSRLAKNKYTWHGKTNLHNTLSKLKVLGDAEGFVEQMEQLRVYEVNKEMKRPCSKSETEDMLSFKSYVRKDKSLGIMSQRFLMLFLVSKPRTVNLDLSAKLLIGDPNIDRTENAKFKTKIRRLYDIANILTSLDLIRKVHVTEIRGRKPAFKYIGPDVDNLTEMDVCSTDGRHRPNSRHSMLHCVQSKGENPAVLNIMNSYRPLRPTDYSTRESDSTLLRVIPDGKNKIAILKKEGKKPFSRHHSFDQICQVAEKERIKLFSNSQPSSPVKELNFEDVDTNLAPKSQSPAIKNIPHGMLKGQNHVIFMQGKQQVHIIPNVSAAEGMASKQESGEEKTVTESSQSLPVSTMMKSSTTVLHLTRNQIDAVLRSLKVPVPVSGDSKTDASTQSSPALSTATSTTTIVNPSPEELRKLCGSPECTLQKSSETTPINAQGTGGPCPQKNDLLHHKTPSESRTTARAVKPIRRANSDPGETTPHSPVESSDAEVARISHQGIKRRISEGQKVPLRALHLQTEFRESPPLAKLPKLSPDVITKDIAADLDLASPLPEEDQSKKPTFPSQESFVSTPSSFSPADSSHQQTAPLVSPRVSVQFPNSAKTTIMQLPVTSSPSVKPCTPITIPQNATVIPIATLPPQFAHPVSLLHGVQVTQNGQINGHPVNVVVPITFTPPPHSER
ncbi:transcription factor E2F8-like [Liolophura sinensis]|uniref:transcription factor E2F8-like n=1 Tax=Liolophura sinensis TaxID=3198878 RepID=UPI003157F81A